MLHKNVCWYNRVCGILLSYKENGIRVIIMDSFGFLPERFEPERSLRQKWSQKQILRQQLTP